MYVSVRTFDPMERPTVTVEEATERGTRVQDVAIRLGNHVYLAVAPATARMLHAQLGAALAKLDAQAEAVSQQVAA